MGTAVFAVAIGIAYLAVKLPGRATWSPRPAVFLLLLAVVRLALSMLDVDSGWLARYYANDSWSGQPEWSSDFRRTDATRIDRTLSFEAGTLPIHFFNGAAFIEGNDREINQPLTVEWRGVFAIPEETPIDVQVFAKDEARVSVDDDDWVWTGALATSQKLLPAGLHTVRVRYRKLAGTAAAISVAVRQGEAHTPVPMFPPGTNPRTRPLVDTLAVLVDVIVLVALLIIAAGCTLIAWRSNVRVPVTVSATVILSLGVQGFLTALPHAYRFGTLTAGDDWLGFESRARDVLQHGLLMTLGEPLGEGVAYFYHPFYSYVLALIHLLTGESLFGPIFANFLFLAATAVVLWSFASEVFGRFAATCGLVALVVVFELDFIRYYTVTLLSENLYVLTVTLCAVAFGRWAKTQRLSQLIQGGVWAGISAVTRPAMMMFFVPALIVVAATAFLQRRSRWVLLAPCITAATWLAVVMPFTLRNWIVARQLVLISGGLGGTFIVHNTPPGIDPQMFMARYSGGIFNGLAVLAQIAVEQPGAFFALQMQKLGFTLGMTHWFGDYRPHPELIAITALYVVMLLLSTSLRGASLWPMHAFVVSHWASMALTSPWNYGYRLILPPFVFTSMLAVAAAMARVSPRLRLSNP